MIFAKRRQIRQVLFLFLLVLFPLSMTTAEAAGSDLEFGADLDQSEFEDLSRQAGLIISYNPLSPAEPLGILGFDIGIETSVIDIDENQEYWEDAVEEGDVPSYVALPRVHVQKGLPLGIDLGVSYAKTPLSNISVIGGEIKWAFLKGGISWPAAAIRGSYTQLLGVDDLSLSTYGVDLSVSKGFAFVTPYAGIGQIWIKSQEHSDLISLEEETVSATKGFLGVKVSILLVNVVGEVALSDLPIYSLRANISF